MISFGFLLVMDNISSIMCFRRLHPNNRITQCLPYTTSQCQSVMEKTWVTSCAPRCEHVFNSVFFLSTTCFRDLVFPGIRLIFHGHETRAVKNYQSAYLNLRAKRRGESLWLCEPNVNMNVSLMDCE